MSACCDNCSSSNIAWQCKDCGDNVYFCDECSKFHSKIKQFRDHIVREKEEKVTLCSNCDRNRAELLCQQCQVGSNVFCHDCAAIHQKVKMFRNHVTTPLTFPKEDALGPSTYLNKLTIYFSHFGLSYLSPFTNDVLDTDLNWKNVFGGLLFAIGLHILMRIIFKRSSLSLLSLALFFGWRIVKKKKLSKEIYPTISPIDSMEGLSNQNRKSKTNIKNVSLLSNSCEDLREENTVYKDEFSYLQNNMEDDFKKFKFREIGRPYVGRYRRKDQIPGS